MGRKESDGEEQVENSTRENENKISGGEHQKTLVERNRSHIHYLSAVREREIQLKMTKK